MVKMLSHGALDAALGYVAARAEAVCLCAGAPGSAREATTSPARGGVMLGLGPLGPDDCAIGPGRLSGRRLVVAEVAPLRIRNAGVACHLAVVGGGEVLLLLPLAGPQAVRPGARVAVAGLVHEITDPA